MTVSLHNRQRGVRLNIRWLRALARLALARCVDASGDGHFALRKIGEVGIALVSDTVIARLHLEFMGSAGPTDVLTFHHGDLVISADTAAAQARRRRHAVEVEIALYTVHGLLHLNGFDDRTAVKAARMRRVQARILRWCRSQLPPP